MSSQIIKVDGKYVYFFTSLEKALDEASYYDNFTVYQYLDSDLYVIGEYNAHNLKRPHITDWNGTLFQYHRLDGESSFEWKESFLDCIKAITIEEQKVA